MSDSPPLLYRLAAGLFGIFLGLSSVVCGGLVLFTLSQLGEDPNGGDGILFLAAGLFTPMTLVLGGSTSAMFVYAFSGRRGPMIHQGALRVALVVLGIAGLAVFIASVLERNWAGILGVVGVWAEMFGLLLGGVVFGSDPKSRGL